MFFYTETWYEGSSLDLKVIDDPDEDKSLKTPAYGNLDDPIGRHKEDLVSQEKVERNEVIYTY
jgi:hypothetical protein